jgi:cellulose synthase/poly-beta-1,6-N-acetylglucosamine synthase-like glycosyltransferase
MYKDLITIIIPIKSPQYLDEFIKINKKYFEQCKVMVIDAGGGEKMMQYSTYYLKDSANLTGARKIGYALAQTPYILNLDCDVKIPKGYIDEALLLLQNNPNVGAVSIFYNNINHCQGALEYGISMWRTELLKRLYDFSFDMTNDGKIIKIREGLFATLNNGWCECTYMWRQLKNAGFKLETLKVKAKHLKEKD